MARPVIWLRDTAAVIAPLTSVLGRAWVPAINTSTGRWHIFDGVTPGGKVHALLSDIPGGSATVYSTPTSGSTVTTGSGEQKHQLTPAGTLAALTYLLPPNPGDDDEHVVSTTQTISAIDCNGQSGWTVLGGDGVLPSNGSMRFRARTFNTTWYRVG